MNQQQRASHYKLYKKVGSTFLWQVKGSAVNTPFFYETGMKIDFDGAPDAYAPQNNRTLSPKDNLGNALALRDKQGRSPWLSPPAKKTDPANNPNWTPTYASTVRNARTGASIIQRSGPYAGYYISESSLKDVFHGAFGTEAELQTNANEYPYVVLPQNQLKDSRLQVGDYALAIHGRSGKYTFAVYGDSKNKSIMGESSSALAKALNLPYDRNGDTPGGVIYIVFPDSGLGPQMRCELSSLRRSAMRWLQLYDDRLDLVAQITACYSPEFPGVASAFASIGL